MRTAIFASVCCVGFTALSVGCTAQTYGGLFTSQQTPSLAQVRERAIAQWLISVPLDESRAQATEAGPQGSWSAPPEPTGAVQNSETATAQMLDANPIGGEFHHFVLHKTLIMAPVRDLAPNHHQRGVAVLY